MILPYRADPADLERFVAARARGRSLEQIRTLNFAPKTFEGTATAAEALGLVEDRNGALTEMGRRFAVASAEDAPALYAEMAHAFAPYGLLVEAVLVGGGPDPTPLHWIETWWATHGYGSSESNRAEGAPVFARVVEAAGLGTFVQGRKGRPSRIEWDPSARTLLAATPTAGPRAADRRPSARAAPPTPAAEAEAPRTPASAEVAALPPPAPTPPPAAPAQPHAPAASAAHPPGEPNVLRWELGPGRSVRLELPGDLTVAERARLREVLALLLAY